MENILIAESNKDIGLVLTRFFTGRGYTSKTINNGADALEELGKQQFNLLLCNCKLNDMTAIEFLQRLKQQNLERKLPVIVMGCCDVNDAVEVMKFGASDCIPNPLYPEKVWEKVQVALNTFDNSQITVCADAKESTINRTTELLPLPQDSDNYFESNCKEYIDVMKQVDLVSPTNFSVIIYGESGSGKEVIAQLIHNKSNRRDKPFVAIDCGALSKELAGSELFGHEKGSFTGALFQKIGSFEMANGGTIFLDEIPNLSYDIQISLLRVVQERKMKRLGSNKDIPLDVRIIVASNEKLWSANKENKFREDLYHRFNEFSINLPPLRERKDDILPFANHFLAKINKELGKTIRGFTEEVERIFTEYIWHGNLRELKNVLKRAALLSEEQYIDIHNLPTELLKHRLETSTLGLCEKADNIYYSGLQDAKADAQGEIILNALKQTNNNKSKAAKLLNIDRKTLYNKLTQYNSFNTNKTAG